MNILKITDFLQTKRPRINRSFINSLLNEIHNFFAEEEEQFKKISQISHFYLPLPRLNIELSEFGGRTSLQFNLYNMRITTEFEKADVKILSRFYRRLIELDLIQNNKKRRIIALDKLYKLFFVSPTLNNSLKQLCNKDTNNNLTFNSKFFAIFEIYKRQAILDIVKNNYETLNIEKFLNYFPALKGKIIEVAKSKKSPLHLTYGYSDQNDISFGIGWEFLRFCSDKLRDKNGNKIISNLDKITESGTDNIKPHITKKMATLLITFEKYKYQEIKNFRNSILFLLKLISYENISKPYWIANRNLFFYYYRTPHGVWRKYNSHSSSIMRNIVEKYNICYKIPFPSNMELIPRKWFKKSGEHVYFASLDSKEKCALIERFYSPQNLSRANTEDEKFLKHLDINLYDQKE